MKLYDAGFLLVAYLGAAYLAGKSGVLESMWDTTCHAAQSVVSMF